jgi:hypothetical protein
VVDIRADYVEVARLAADVLAGSAQLADGWLDARKDLAPPASVFGNSKAGPSLAEAHRNAVDDADATIDRQTNVLSDDVDRLYRVAFAYEKQEADAQADLYRSGHGGQSLRGVP